MTSVREGMDIDAMTGAEIRGAMIEKLGWHSNDSYSSFGWNKWGYSIWFERFDWHGVRINKICFHSHTDNPELIETCIKAAAKRALDAWDKFKDAVPVQTAPNSAVVEDGLATRFFRESRESKQ